MAIGVSSVAAGAGGSLKVLVDAPGRIDTDQIFAPKDRLLVDPEHRIVRRCLDRRD